MHHSLLSCSKAASTKPHSEVKDSTGSSASLARTPRPMENDTRNPERVESGGEGPARLPASSARPPKSRPRSERPAHRGDPRSGALKAGGTLGGRILQMPVFSARPRMRPMKPSGSLNSSQLGSNTGHSGGGTNSAA